MGPGGATQRVVLVPRHGRGRIWAAASGGVLIGAAVTLLGLSVGGVFDDAPFEPAVERVVTDASGGIDAATVDLAAPVLPAIVRIDARTPTTARSGTGVIIRTDGHVLATSDLVDGATDLRVTLRDGAALPATLVGRDRDSDIAVLKVDGTDLPVATLVDPPGNESVNQVIAFGDPAIVIDAAPAAGPTPALTDGFVSEASRRLDGDSGSMLFGVIQVSTSPRDTASGIGQVLIDGDGAVLGIVTARGGTGPEDSASADGLVLRFATPADHAYRIFEQLTTHGRVLTPLLGIQGVDVAGPEAQRLGVTAGLHIEVVETDSPAADAGLRRGDVVVGFGGHIVAGLNDLVVALRMHDPGDPVVITYVRRAERDVTTAVLAERASLP